MFSFLGQQIGEHDFKFYNANNVTAALYVTRYISATM